MYRTDGNVANTGGRKKKAELLLQFSRMIDRPPYFKIGAERTYALGLAGYRSFLFIRAALPCRGVISVFTMMTDSSTSWKEMTLGRDTVAFACLSVRTAQRRRLSETTFPHSHRPISSSSAGTFIRAFDAVLFRICCKSDFKTYWICIIHGSGCSWTRFRRFRS